MINLYNTKIGLLFIHKIGNKAKKGVVTLSNEPVGLNDELRPLIKEYFFKPFRKKELGFYAFEDSEDNILNLIAKRIFEDPGNVGEYSKDIAHHLFDQSIHPHIKDGELYVCHIENVIIDNRKTSAIGIFKSEVKHDYLKLQESVNNVGVYVDSGINLNKLDKGCIIFNRQELEGYKILTIDSNRYDSKYWLQSFLNVEVLKDDSFYTKNYLKLVQNFGKDVVLPAEDKTEEVLFLNRAVDHFGKNDEFEETAFLNDVFSNPDLIPEFVNYKEENAPKWKIEDVSDFDINNTAVAVERKKIKSLIKLDTNIQIKMNFINPESVEKFVEKGYDEEKQMYYYLVYFNKELK